MFSLQNKVAVVTGGASGIGAAIVNRFRDAGARVVIFDLRADSEDAFASRVDVSSEAAFRKALHDVCHHHGSLDILVNNAGIQPLGVGFNGLSESLFAHTLAVNAGSVAFGIKHAGQLMRLGGRVINLASFVGVIGVPLAAAYGTSKAAVAHLTRLGAIELASKKITVNAISPGTIRTPAVTDIADNPEIPFVEERTPLRRLGEPSEVAALAHFLASEEAAYITGQNIGIDGGITAGWPEYAVIAPSNVQNGAWVEHV
ncbi:MAG TPA: SDR family oxidoreductase [Opitutaceae bacterium]